MTKNYIRLNQTKSVKLLIYHNVKILKSQINQPLHLHWFLNNKERKFKASNENEMSEWIKHIKHVIYDQTENNNSAEDCKNNDNDKGLLSLNYVVKLSLFKCSIVK